MLKQIILSLMLCFFLLPGFSQTVTEWQADLRYLQQTVHSKYNNLFYNITAADWNKAVDDFNNQIPKLEKEQVLTGFIKLVADIMKYILAEGKEDKVMLQKEIQLLYNYTELERLRKPDAEIIFNAPGNTGNYFITPLLLLPLVENAFKYGLNSVAKNGFVRINMKTEGKGLNVTVENNIPPVKNSEALQSLGIGIENVKKRLEMLYAGKYALSIENRSNSFFVNLQLQLA